MKTVEVIIIGAGAAGLMCAIEAGKRHRLVLVLDHANKVGKKILMSGGGRCNFTNYHIHPDKYLSQNPHFCKSALSRYTQWNFIELVKKYRISFHEKTQGQLFCDNSAKDIVNLLLLECEKHAVTISLNTTVENIEKDEDDTFHLKTSRGNYRCQSLVIASGGLSIPTMGATPYGYKVAEQFGLKVWPTRAGLVPLTLHEKDKATFSSLSGISIESRISNQRIHFDEATLFTHRGLSGPAILQISSYWQAGDEIIINMLPALQFTEALGLAQQSHPHQHLKAYLLEYLPKRLLEAVLPSTLLQKQISSLTAKEIESLKSLLHHYSIKPNGTEGYRTAEVTLGGIDCNLLSSKTMEVTHMPGLYFIGEVVDVTGWLGGYNFQWAWSSGWAAGQVV